MQPKIFDSFKRIPRGKARYPEKKPSEPAESSIRSSSPTPQVVERSGDGELSHPKGRLSAEEVEERRTVTSKTSAIERPHGKRHGSEPYLRASVERDSSDRPRAPSVEKRRAREDLHSGISPKKRGLRWSPPSQEEVAGRHFPNKHRSSLNGKRPDRGELRSQGGPSSKHSTKTPPTMEDHRKDNSDKHRAFVAEKRRSFFEERHSREEPRDPGPERDSPFQKPKEHSSKGQPEKEDTAGSSSARTASPFAKSRREDLRNRLRDTAAGTLSVLPTIVSQLPASINPAAASIHHFKDLAPLKPENCPGFQLPAADSKAGHKGTRIQVLDQDSFDAALRLQPGITARSLLPTTSTTSNDSNKDNNAQTPSSNTNAPPTSKPVALLNLASDRYPGGGWLNGALAQEEALCYRSTLSLSFHKEFYPIPLLSALYTPHVLVIREALSAGHKLLLQNPAATTPSQCLDLPVTSVITLAAIRNPYLTSAGSFRASDAEITRYKIRTVLRVAAHQGHTKLVLGALGCGAFNNPPEEIAQMFLEVLREEEFTGGWWEELVFAVMDNARAGEGGKQGEGNYGIFWRVLDGLVV